MEPKVSVALCTYNGARYLQAQLESLADQTIVPSELVVGDDGSMDETLDILRQFSASAPFPVKVLRNKYPLGAALNFSATLKHCNGDFVALCDQDDVWGPDKLKILTNYLIAARAPYAFCNASVTDGDLKPWGKTLWQQLNFSPEEQKQSLQGNLFAPLLKHYIVSGACMVFDAQILKQILPIPEGWQHDAWLAIAGAALGAPIPIPLQLQCYRQHQNNVVGARRRSLWEEIWTAASLNRKAYYQQEILSLKILHSRLVSLQANIEKISDLEKKIAHLSRRQALPQRRPLRIKGVLHEIFQGNYRRYARNWGSIALDILIE